PHHQSGGQGQGAAALYLFDVKQERSAIQLTRAKRSQRPTLASNGCELLLVCFALLRRKRQQRVTNETLLSRNVELRKHKYKRKHWPGVRVARALVNWATAASTREWRWQNEFGEVGQLALLQLATDDRRALLIRVQRLTVVPPQLEAFLADRTAIRSWLRPLRLGGHSVTWPTVCRQIWSATVAGLKPLANHMLSVDYFKLQRKADWYTERGLATVVSTDPILIIRVKFRTERGRPRGDQAYYLAERDNRC
uniref:PseudoU_synth_2 domain-containing protein n=1 Tax=Macrostomum lignano TaxID=282301 RepID=A0A1I8JLM5_9PLAT